MNCHNDMIDQPTIVKQVLGHPAGNHGVIKMDETHYALLAHMKQDSVVFAVGNRVSIFAEARLFKETDFSISEIIG